MRENRISDLLKKHYAMFLIVLLTIIAAIVRYEFRYYKSLDAREFLIPWFNTIKENGGLLGLGERVGNYNIPYQILIAIGTYLPFGDIVWVKIISSVFDISLAAGVTALIKVSVPNIKKYLLVVAYGVTLFLPTVVMDSAIWGQCDSIYVSFIIWALFLLKIKKNIWSFIFLGLAFAFKLQVIFILPFFAFYYIAKKNFNIWHFLLILVPDVILCLPVLPFGRTFFETFDTYFGQAGLYSDLVMNTNNFWGLFGEPGQAFLQKPAIIITFIILVLGLVAVLIEIKKVPLDLDDNKSFILLALWCAMTMVMYMPNMHERYTYLVDILLLIMVFVDRKYIALFMLEGIISALTYMKFLFGFDYPMLILSLINIGVWIGITVDLFIITSKQLIKKQKTVKQFNPLL